MFEYLSKISKGTISWLIQNDPLFQMMPPQMRKAFLDALDDRKRDVRKSADRYAKAIRMIVKA